MNTEYSKLIIYYGNYKSLVEAISTSYRALGVKETIIKLELNKLLVGIDTLAFMAKKTFPIICPEIQKTPLEQIEWTRELVKVINMGYTIYLATMSDYIVKELTNCIMLSNLDSLEGLGYEECHKLDYNKVESYEVRYKDSELTYIKHRVNSRQGIFATFFDEAIDFQNEMQDRIFERVIENKNEQSKESK